MPSSTFAHHPLPRRLARVIAFVLTGLLMLTVGPASAQTTGADRPSDSPADRPANSPADRPADRPVRDRDHLRLACAAVRADQPVIGCRWSAGPQGTAGYVLLRAAAGQTAETIARVGRDQTAVRDEDVEPGVRYVYLVRAVTEDGRQIAHSNRERAAIAPDTELMRLGCRPIGTIDDANPDTVESDHPTDAAIGCRWTRGPVSTHHYVVLRTDTVTDEVTVVARLDADQTEIRDSHVRPGVRYTYLVRAESEEGRELNHSNRASAGVPA